MTFYLPNSFNGCLFKWHAVSVHLIPYRRTLKDTWSDTYTAGTATEMRPVGNLALL